MKNLEESRPDFTKSWLNEKKHFKILAFEISMRWEELKRAQEMRIDEFFRHESRESHAKLYRNLLHRYRSCRKEMNYMNDSRKISRCRINLQWKIIPRAKSTSNFFQVLEEC